MGEPVVVRENPSSRPGVVRFMTDRLLTGMGHERYLVDDEVWGERPPDVLARRIFARGGVDGVQVHGNIVTVDLQKGFDSDGLLSIIENMYVHYPENQVGDAAPAAVVEDVLVGDVPVDEVVASETGESSVPAVAPPAAGEGAVVAETDPDAG